MKNQNEKVNILGEKRSDAIRTGEILKKIYLNCVKSILRSSF